ncbi:hypothetical protein O181_110293 [Austropuccinia psidii MF-1]|uniref:Uncharacterized protein n=1 Tax=Austropuccinia psidii MF-1 TaxID=1389203 RepID=A0A9Q3JWD0_9BASI|nr:hypothetical protein [Austropuccinia psidii MF-1]
MASWPNWYLLCHNPLPLKWGMGGLFSSPGAFGPPAISRASGPPLLFRFLGHLAFLKTIDHILQPMIHRPFWPEPNEAKGAYLWTQSQVGPEPNLTPQSLRAKMSQKLNLASFNHGPHKIKKWPLAVTKGHVSFVYETLDNSNNIKSTMTVLSKKI